MENTRQTLEGFVKNMPTHFVTTVLFDDGTMKTVEISMHLDLKQLKGQAKKALLNKRKISVNGPISIEAKGVQL